MSYRIAPAARAALVQATLLWPRRNKTHDGTIGDAAHRARKSWHNPSNPDGTPNPNGTVYAFDLSHDPERGCDAHALARQVAGTDQRVLEAISLGRIWTKARAAEGWRPYSHADTMPHDLHCHITVDPRYATDTSPWWVGAGHGGRMPGTSAPTTPPTQEDEMTDADMERLINAFRTVIGQQGGKDTDPTHDSLADIRRDLAEIKKKLGI